MGVFSTDPGCIKQREYVNIPAWHEAGYLGEGQSVFCDDVGGSHVAVVADIIQTILPKSKVYTGSNGFIKKGGVISEFNVNCQETGELLPFDDFVKKYNITLINNSTDGGNGEEILPEAIYMKSKIKEYNLIMTGAAGNAYTRPTEQPYNGACIMVSAVKLQDGKAVYSPRSEGQNIDFAMFQGYTGGTSNASPFLLGMAGLLRCKYPGITQDEVYQYFKKHSKDVGAPGRDIRGGWGVPVLGDPKTKIKLQLGSNIMRVDEREVSLDQPPQIVRSTNRTLVPVRAISEAFGANVDWDEKTKTITIAILGDPKTKIKLQIGSNIMRVDDRDITLDQPPEIVRSTKRTLVPIRAISEAFEATVDWDEKNKTITIVK